MNTTKYSDYVAACEAEDAKVIKEFVQNDPIDWAIVYDHRLSVLKSLRAAADNARTLSKRLSESLDQHAAVASVFNLVIVPARVFALANRYPSLAMAMPARAGRTMMALSALREQYHNKINSECAKINQEMDQLAKLRTTLTKHLKAIKNIVKPERSEKIQHPQIEQDVKNWDDFAHAKVEFLMQTMAAHTSLASVLSSVLAPLAQSLPLDIAAVMQAVAEGAPSLHHEMATWSMDQQPPEWKLTEDQLAKVEELLGINASEPVPA